MWLIVAIVLLVLFFGLGFLAHLLWLGLIVAAVFFVIHALTSGSRTT